MIFKWPFKKKGEFNINLFNPFELIKKVGNRINNDSVDLDQRFHLTIKYNYKKCVETILNTLTKIMHNIIDQTYIELRKDIIHLFSNHLTPKNIQFISKFLQNNELRFITFLNTLQLPDIHYVKQHFPDQLHALISLSKLHNPLADKYESPISLHYFTSKL